jgi:predicted phage terminase large subunit-like protein
MNSAVVEDLILKHEQAKRKLERSFPKFVEWSWSLIDPHKFIGGRHIEVLGEYLTAVRSGEIPRLIVSMPPRLGKSSLITIQFPAWVWTTIPESQWMFSSYAESLCVDDHNVRRRRLIESPEYQQFWQVQMTADSNQKWKYVNTKRGHMMAKGMGSGTQGFGGDWLVIDDPQSVDDAHSKLEAQKAIAHVREGLFTRLNDPATARIVEVQQRLDDNDVTAHLLEDGTFAHLCLEAEAEKHLTIFLPLTKTYWIREKGECLEPIRFGKAVLDQKRIDLGSVGYAAQMQQSPTPSGGAIFKPADARYYKELPILDMIMMSVDCSFKDVDASDFVCIQAWGFAGADAYLIDMFMERVGLTGTLAQIGAYMQVHKCNGVLIEDKANGPAAIDALKSKYNVIAINPEGGKESRAWAIQPTWEAHHVHLPDVNYEKHRDKKWVAPFVENMSKFRGEGTVKHDDDIDACTQAINWRRKNMFGIVQYYKELNDDGSKSATSEVEMKEEKMGQEKALEATSGAQIAKVVTNPNTPKCKQCGGVTFIKTQKTDGSVEMVCSKCDRLGKCPSCKAKSGHRPGCGLAK